MGSTLDGSFMLFLMITGIFMAYFSSKCFSLINENCTQPLVRTSLTLIMVLSCICITIPVTYGFCVLELDCANQVGSETKSSIYMFIAMALSITLIILCSMILTDIKKDKTNCGGSSAFTNTIVILVLSIILLIVSSGIIFIKYKDFFIE